MRDAFRLFVATLVVSLLVAPFWSTEAQASQALVPVGQVGGATLAAHVDGDYAYIGQGPRLVVLDVSMPASPRVLGRSAILPGLVLSVDVTGDYAYIAAGRGGLRILSVEDKAHPVEVGHFRATLFYAYSVRVVGDYAYVADGRSIGGGLSVISVADASRPREAGWILTGTARDVDVVGDRAYVANDGQGLTVVSVTDPEHPQEIGRIASGSHLAVDVVASHAYVATGGANPGLWVYDVSDLSSISGVEFVTSADDQHDVTVVDDRAYLVDNYGTLRVISVADKEHPALLGSLDLPGAPSAYGIQIVGSNAFVAGGSGGFRVVTVADPAHPLEIGVLDEAFAAGSVDADGDHAYVAADDGLLVVSVVDPGGAAVVGRYAVSCSYPSAVEVRGEVAYLTAGGQLGNQDCGLYIVAVSDPRAPARLGFLSLATQIGGPFFSAHDVAVSGGYAYVAASMEGLRVISVEDAAHPVEVGWTKPATVGFGDDVALAGDYAYLGESLLAALSIVSVADPTAPMEVGHVGWADTSDSIVDVAVAGRYLYLTQERTELRILDISDPQAPKQVGWLGVSDDFGSAIDVLGENAYIAADNQTRVVSVADPTSPVQISSYRTASDPGGVDAEGDYVYVADGSGGLLILKLVPAQYGVALSTGAPVQGALPGVVVRYPVRVTNSGNTSDSYAVTLSGAGWATAFDRATVADVGAGEFAYLDITVTVPAGATPGQSDTVHVTVASVADPERVASVALTTTASRRPSGRYRMYAPALRR